MLNDCKIDVKLINQMFPDLDKLIQLHKNLLNKLIDRYKKSNEKYVNSIGDILKDIVNAHIFCYFYRPIERP